MLDMLHSFGRKGRAANASGDYYVRMYGPCGDIPLWANRLREASRLRDYVN